MHFYNQAMIFGALLLLTNLKGMESFNHHRGVAHINTDSHEDVETTTIDDDLVDSREHLNETSTETSNDVHDDLSLEDLANSTAVPIETTISDDSAFEVLDDLRDKLHDDLHEPASSENIIKRSALVGEPPIGSTVHHDFSREDFADFFHHDANNNHAAAIDALDDIYDDYSFEEVPAQPVISAQVQPVAPQTVHSVVDHHDVHDFSLEDFAQQAAVQQGQTVHVDYDDVSAEDILEANLEAVQPAAVPDFTHTIVQQGKVQQGRSLGVDIDDISTEDIVDPSGTNLEDAQPAVVFDPTHPAAGEHVFSHPASDDWFLVKQYMDDYYFWELGDDLAKEYFWQPIKATKILQFDSAERLNAEQFAQFTPVRSLWNDRVGSTVA